MAILQAIHMYLWLCYSYRGNHCHKHEAIWHHIALCNFGDASNRKPRSLPSIDGKKAIVIRQCYGNCKIGKKLGKVLYFAKVDKVFTIC